MKETINLFRRRVYQAITKRSDALLDLCDAVTTASTVESPVAVSESPLFQRAFSSVYDGLEHGEIDEEAMSQLLYDSQPETAETIGGYELYIVDCTEEPHQEAETLPDRTQSRRGKHSPLVKGHRYSHVMRGMAERTSWCAPQDVKRVASDTTDSAVAVEQVKQLDKRSDCLKVVVADSLYGNAVFLAVFLVVKTVAGLVRLRSNRVLWENPPAYQGKGRPRKHGAKFKLSQPSREPDRTETFQWLQQTIRVKAWQGLHVRQLPTLIGMVLTIEFLRTDGEPRYKRPIYLFWTGAETVSLPELCRMYLWRFAIEHSFRYLKQHMGLTVNRSPNLHNHKLWVWVCLISYTQLLLMRHIVADQRPAWHPTHRHGNLCPMTPRQVQRVALPLLLQLGTPSQPTRPAKKGRGRPQGYKPTPRKRHTVVRKGKKKPKKR